MAPTLQIPARAALLPTAERMAKADLRKPESPPDPANHVGAAITEARLSVGWSLKEFSAVAQRGERQLARWENGSEHAQLDTLFAILPIRRPLIIALAKRAGLGIRTTITIDEAA